MIISNIEIIQFRNYNQFKSDFSTKLNWIYGENGQGKTNLVEAIHYVCNLDSFRSKNFSQIIQQNKSVALIQALIERSKVQNIVRINLSKKGRQVTVNHKPSYQVSEHIFSYMAIAFTPESTNLFRNAPQDRRKFINKIISFLNPAYFKDLQECRKIIVQKNALLRMRNDSKKQLNIWNKMLAINSIKLMEERLNFVEQVNIYLSDVFMELSGRSENLRLIYEPSLDYKNSEEKKIIKQIEKNLSKEMQYGFSILGPHRDEFFLTMNDKKDKDFFSQGEFRITNLSLKMTINRLLYERYKFYPILILDDLFSELDDEVTNYVIQALIKTNNQIFITSTSKPSYSFPGKCIKIAGGTQV